MSRHIINNNKISLTEMQAEAGMGNMNGASRGGKLLFTHYQGREAALLLQEDRLKAVQFFDSQPSKIGAVYICKVKNAVKNINAFFVEIGGGEREICFLADRDAADPFLLNRPYDGRILEGDEFPVQIIRDAQKTKQAAVTTRISLSNEYFVMSVGGKKTGYSGKLSPQEKTALKEIAEKAGFEAPQIPFAYKNKSGERQACLSVGFVVRTKAAELAYTASCNQHEATLSYPREETPGGHREDITDYSQEENTSGSGFDGMRSENSYDAATQLLADSFQELSNRFEALFQSALHHKCFSCLLEAPAPWVWALEQMVYPGEYEEILTDDRVLFEEMKCSGAVPAKKRLRFYDEQQSEELPLAQLYGLEGKLETALGRRVWLKSGGYLVIDPTEALTVIDVNSGKLESGKGKLGSDKAALATVAEAAYHRVNLEAAKEVALQLRLRNLSGIIIVDFISIKDKERQAELLEYLREQVKTDRQKTTVVDITPLGLVEITRKKGSKPLAEQQQTN